MKKFGKNRVLASLLLSACTIGTENPKTEAFSQNFVLDGSFSISQLNEIDDIEDNSTAFKKYIRINGKVNGRHKQTIILTLAGIRKENNDKWKTILRALKKTRKKLKFQLSNEFEKYQTACSTFTDSGDPVIIFNKKYFNSENIEKLQQTMCHEIGHIYMESILINKGKQRSWEFNDRNIEDFVDPAQCSEEFKEFCREYRLYKEEMRKGKISKYGSKIYTNAGQPITRYGLRSKDDTEMIADSMAEHLMGKCEDIEVIAGLAAHATRNENVRNKRRNGLRPVKIRKL